MGFMEQRESPLFSSHLSTCLFTSTDGSPLVFRGQGERQLICIATVYKHIPISTNKITVDPPRLSSKERASLHGTVWAVPVGWVNRKLPERFLRLKLMQP